MALRSFMYGDPSKVCENKEIFESTCVACRLHKLKPDRSGYHCLDNQPIYPNGTDKSCKMFSSKRKPE